MVDRVSGQDNNAIQESLLGGRTRQVEEVNRKAAEEGAAVGSLSDLIIDDEASISSGAHLRLEAEKFGRLAQRVEEPVNHEKVTRLKELVNSGRINEYLRTINTDELAQKILEGPTGAFLKQ